MALVWVFSCGELVKTARGCVLSQSRSFSASCVMVWMASGMCCRVGRMASAGRRACLYRLAPPLPLGAGDYVRSAGMGSGVSSRFSLYRGSSSCHLVVSVVIAPRSACFVAPPVVISLVPHVLRSRPLCPSCVCSPPRVLVWFLIVLLPVPSTSRAGRFVACFASLRCVSCLSSLASVSPCLLALRVIVLRRHRFRSSSPSPLPVSRRLPVCLFSPFFDKRGRGACRLVLCLLIASLSFSSAVSPVVRAACGGLLFACPGIAGGRCGVVGCGCVRFVVSLFVYIN